MVVRTPRLLMLSLLTEICAVLMKLFRTTFATVKTGGKSAKDFSI